MPGASQATDNPRIPSMEGKQNLTLLLNSSKSKKMKTSKLTMREAQRAIILVIILENLA